MSFLGKEYAYDSNEGIDTFLESVGKTLPEEFKEIKIKVEAGEDEGKYTLFVTTPNGVQETVFEDGVEFDDEVQGTACKTSMSIDGDVLTSKWSFENGTFTLTSEYADDTMTVSVGVEGHDSLATVTFKEA